MFILGNTLRGFATVLDMVLNIYTFILIGRAIISWVDANPYNPIVRFLMMATDPLTHRIRRLLPAKLRYFPLDISFLVLFGIVVFSRVAIVQTLYDIGARLR